jgi:hypothetical protein
MERNSINTCKRTQKNVVEVPMKHKASDMSVFCDTHFLNQRLTTLVMNYQHTRFQHFWSSFYAIVLQIGVTWNLSSEWVVASIVTYLVKASRPTIPVLISMLLFQRSSGLYITHCIASCKAQYCYLLQPIGLQSPILYLGLLISPLPVSLDYHSWVSHSFQETSFQESTKVNKHIHEKLKNSQLQFRALMSNIISKHNTL